MVILDRPNTAPPAVQLPPAADRVAPPPLRVRLPPLVALAPYVVASVLLLLGYLHYRTGTPFSLSPDHYRAWAFPAFRYSDLIWLYLRDNLAARPLPYVDYPLEYPPLIGVVSWLLSYAPDLAAYFALTYALLAAAALATIWALARLPGANPWYYAAAPALFFYVGHQWEPLVVGVTALALAALAAGRRRLGVVGLAAGVSLKLFPLAFLAALCADDLRHRRWRRLAETLAIAAAVTLAANLPFALANLDGWGFFFRWNRDRLADSGPWVLLRGLPTETLTAASLAAAVVGGGTIVLFALWRGGPILLPLGATALLWWLLVNKTFTTHLILWPLLAVAILRPPVWLWLAVVAVDVVGFQLGNYLNLYNVPEYQSAPLIRKAVENVYDPLQLARTLVLLACVGWGVRVIWRREGAALPLAGSSPGRRLPNRSGALTRRPAVRRSVLAAGAAVALSYAAAAVAMTWPYVRHLRDATIVGFDPLLQIWLSRWVQHALATNPAGLWGANIFYPFPNTLAYTDANLPGALLAWPLELLTGDPLLTNGLLVLASFVLAGGGVYALVAYLTGNRAAAWLAGLAWAFVPWRMVQLWHLNWLQGAWLPWVAWALLRLLERPTPARAVLLGALAGVLTLTSLYFAVQIALLLGALLVAAAIAESRFRTAATARALFLAAAVAAALVLPALPPYAAVRNEQGLERTLAEAEEYKAAPASYLRLPPWAAPNPLQRALGINAGENRALTTVGQARHADGHRHAEIVIEDALYPGAFALLGAVAGVVCWRGRRWPVAALAAVALVAAALSLGPSLGPPDGSGPALPYRWLFDQAPGFRAMRVPARLGGLVALALAVLAGFGVAAVWARWGTAVEAIARSWRSRSGGMAAGPPSRASPNRQQGTALVARPTLLPAALTLAVAAPLLLDLAAVPVPLEPVDRSADVRAPYEWLATQPPGEVMEFPAESIFADPAGSSVRRHVGLSMLWSTLHWQPLVNGNSGFIPRAHSDLLERFVGNLPRPDGSLALRVSHVNRDTARLLQRLGVRYLLFHTDQYRPEDWSAVAAQLGEAEGLIERVGRFGQTEVWRLQESIATARPTVTLWAPTLLAPGDGWAPVAAVAWPGPGPAPLALTRPATVAARWYDRDGRFLRRVGWRLPMPAVAEPGTLACSPVACRRAGDNLPAALPAPASSNWRPEEPGHYVVKLSLAGDLPVSCQIDLDVVDDGEQAELAPDEPRRWAECAQGSDVPVNDPGAAPFAATPPSVTFAGDTLALQTSLAARAEAEVRGWFLLAPPGDATPWRSAVWRAPVEQKVVRPDEPAAFSWLVRPSGVPPGVYGLTIWFHRRGEAGWEHALGGGFDLAPVVVDPGGGLRWAGPIRLLSLARPAPLVVGRTTPLAIGVVGERDDLRCRATWRLVAPESGRIVTTGNVPDCRLLPVRPGRAVPPGSYRLEISLLADGPGGTRLSDGATVLVAVVGESPRGRPR